MKSSRTRQSTIVLIAAVLVLAIGLAYSLLSRSETGEQKEELEETIQKQEVQIFDLEDLLAQKEVDLDTKFMNCN